MPRHEGHIIAKRPKPVGDGVDQRLVVAARKIGAADRALKQHVAHNGEPARCVKEDDVTGRMARAMTNLKGLLAKRHGIAVGKPAIGFEGLEARKAKAHTLLRQLVNPETIVWVRALKRYSIRSRSPPGSTAAARRVVSQMRTEQFCSNGVTGTIRSFRVMNRAQSRGAAG